MNPEPFRIEPTFSPRIWGARSLAPIFPEKTGLQEPIGEAWLTDVRCRVASGPFVGKCLSEAWTQMPADWRGTRCAAMRDFPLLVKFIFPSGKLSIQVHPDDAYASVHERDAGGRGKTEMWHVVSAQPGTQLLLGLKPGTTRESFVAELDSGKLEELFQTHTVKAGQTFFIPAGVPHTIGPGMILCEVQQYSDLTYRVYDYGRVDAQGKPRGLHAQKALDVIRFDDAPIGAVPTVKSGRGDSAFSLLAACRYFATERWLLTGPLTEQAVPGTFHLLVVAAGSGELGWETNRACYERGQCWFVPASLRQYDIAPSEESVILRAFVPDLAVLKENLRVLGVPDSRIAQVVFE